MEQTVSQAFPVTLADLSVELLSFLLLHHSLTLARGDEPRTSWARGLLGHRPSPVLSGGAAALERTSTNL